MRTSVLVSGLIFFFVTINIVEAMQLELVSHYPFGGSYDVVANDGFLYAGTGCEVRIWDIRDESKLPYLNWNNSIAKIYTWSLVKGLYVDGKYLYIAAEKHFVIADISDPLNPVVVSVLDYPDSTGVFNLSLIHI